MQRLLTLLLLAACSGSSSHPTVGTANGMFTDNITVKSSSTTCDFALNVTATEDASTPWGCPGCATIYRSPLSITSGTDCLMGLLGKLPPTGYFGWSTDDKFYWGLGYGYADPGQPAGTVTVSGNSVNGTINIDNANLSANGSVQLTLGTQAGDVQQGFVPAKTYSCGWPKTNPPAYTGSYTVAAGDQIPDGVFQDQCGDNVRLHDLLGRYIVAVMNQTIAGTCGPCDMAAAGQAQFEADMKTAGIDTLVVSFLVPDYGKDFLEPTQFDLQAWVSANNVTGPALADRGFGNSVLSTVATHGDLTMAGYPAFVVIAADGTILTGSVGFDANTTWSSIETQIHQSSGK